VNWVNGDREPVSGADPPESSRGPEEAEGDGASVGEAKWGAMKDLERRYPGLSVEQVEFEVLSDGSGAGERARVRAVADLSAWRLAESEFEWPDEAVERVREVLRRITVHLGLRASVDVEETDSELRAAVSGGELGLFIGKRGQTIDAVQLICVQAAYRGKPDRKRVIVDAGGYRERREAALRRQADAGVADALRYGRPVELDSMSSQERKLVHLYLERRPEVATHSEGDEPFRRIVITPIRTTPGV
jgi:spoIIIJ-associated protein